MRIHHLNCGSLCPIGGWWMDGFSRGLRGQLVCHCLLIESDSGLVLVDTGFGLEDVRDPKRRLSSFFRFVNGIQLREEDTAVRQIEKLGFRRQDVRHIILTHLDFDHAGGLSDFPDAHIHLLDAELKAAQSPRTWLDRQRYRFDQWADQNNWITYPTGGDDWFQFSSVRDLTGLPPEILLVPLIGHTWGHTGVAIHLDNSWLLHAGDAYFYRGEMNPQHPYCTLGLAAYQRFMDVDRASRMTNQARLRALIETRPPDVQVFSSHDPVEFTRMEEREEERKVYPINRNVHDEPQRHIRHGY